MKPEQEFHWMVRLLNSPHLKGSIFRKSHVALKKDFERAVETSENNKEFRAWINELIDNKIIEKVGTKKVHSREWGVYVINEGLLEKKLEKSPLFNGVRKVIDSATNRVI